MYDRPKDALTSLHLPAVLKETSDIRHAVRRLRWFSKSFKHHLQFQSDVHFVIDDRRLADSFVDWLHSFEVHKQSAIGRERDFVRFASGLMLRALVVNEPIREAALPADADRDDPAFFWPEGYAYVSYCLYVRTAILEQDFDEPVGHHPHTHDIRVWRSFRENMSEDVTLAIPFLDYFAGAPANWLYPDFFSSSEGDRETRPGNWIGSTLG